MANLKFCEKHNMFSRIASARLLDNGEIELNATVDGKDKTITEASVRRHLKLADAGGISTLPTTKSFKQLALMGYVTDSDKLTFQKDKAITKEMHDGLGRATTTASSLKAEQGSGNISETQTKATPYRPSSLRTCSEGVKRSKQGEAHEKVGHKMEIDDTKVVDFSTASPQKDDDEITLAETLVNIKKSAAKDKGKAIMQESDPSKKIKKKKMI
nr:hypothetical protein [Tanacetum cinerariifolium]